MAEHIEVLRIEIVNVGGQDEGQGDKEVGNLLKNKKTAKPLSYTEKIKANNLTKSALPDTPTTLPTASEITAKPSMNITKKGVTKALGFGFGAATTGVALIGQHVSDMQSLSGASHAAERTQKNVKVGLFAAGMAVSVATGQYWATALMLAGRAVQYGLENRKEIFKLKLDRTVSALKQERLVKDTTHRLSNTK